MLQIFIFMCGLAWLYPKHVEKCYLDYSLIREMCFPFYGCYCIAAITSVGTYQSIFVLILSNRIFNFLVEGKLSHFLTPTHIRALLISVHFQDHIIESALTIKLETDDWRHETYLVLDFHFQHRSIS